MSLTRELQQCMSVVFLFLVEFKSNRPGNKRSAFFAGSNTLGFEGFELAAGLLAVADRVVGAERYLLAAGKPKFLAPLLEIPLVQGPRPTATLPHNPTTVPD